MYTRNLYITIHPPELLHKPDQHTVVPEVLQYEQWLPQWIIHLTDAPSVLTIPLSASRIHMPLNPSAGRITYLLTQTKS